MRAGCIALLVLGSSLVSLVVLLFTGSYPRDLHEFLVGLKRWAIRVVAYAGLMRNECPPFRLAP